MARHPNSDVAECALLQRDLNFAIGLLTPGHGGSKVITKQLGGQIMEIERAGARYPRGT